MLKQTISIISILSCTLLFTYCGSPDTGSESDKNESDEPAATEKVDKSDKNNHKEEAWLQRKNGITLRETSRSPEFPDARLSLKTVASSLKPGKNTFEFSVNDYKLREQTDGKPHCANSSKGQHIHFIIDNGPYAAHYNPKVETELSEGKHLMVAFLSRSYHESIKNGSAHVVKQLNVGNAKGEDFDLTAPHLIYSRPKGTYPVDMGSPLLLDFFLLNTNLSKDGNKVRVTIDGTKFEVPEWNPYVVDGLEPGEHTFRIELIDKNGKLVPGPFNDSGERTITIGQQEG